MHNDGARLLDAAVALDVAPPTLLEVADTSTLCLSKGIGCPVGTVLVGDEAFATEAKRARKLLGGGMRQSGILAAAGLHALDEDGLPQTLEEIARAHGLARQLAATLAELDGVTAAHDTTAPFDPGVVGTNIVRFGVPGDRAALLAVLDRAGIGALRYGAGIRMVTHRRLTGGDIERVADVLREHLG
jgi:threonine aldolase